MTVTGKAKQLPAMSNVRIQDTKCLKALYEDNPKLQEFNPDSQYVGSESINSKVHMHLADITDVLVDAIICSTQTDLLLEPYGLCKTVWSRGGQELVKRCRHISFCQQGQAFVTQGYDLPVKYIIHTAGPPPNTPLSYEERKQCLRQSYFSCLQIVAETDDIKSVAIPCLGSGGAGIQQSHAVHIGVTALRDWLEIGDNKTKVDNILLCMYDQDQWEEYYPQLIKTFPYGRDCAGYDLDSLPKVNAQSVHITREGIHQSNISSIYCFKYDSSQSRWITFNFHSLVNSCLRKLGRSADPNNVIRFNSCAKFELHLANHYCIICHTDFSEYTAIEIQVVNMDEKAQTQMNDVCQQVEHEVASNLESFMENFAEPDINIRCRNSTWGKEYGLWKVEVLKRTGQVACIHPRFEDTHHVRSHDLLNFWTVSRENSENCNQSGLASGRREPVEHGEPSFTGEQETNPGGNRRPVQENSWQFPTQHSDTSLDTVVKRADANNTRLSSSAMPDSSSEGNGKLSGLRGIFNKITGKDSKKQAAAAASPQREETIEKVMPSIDGQDASGEPDLQQLPKDSNSNLKHHRSQSDGGHQSERTHQYLTLSKGILSCPGAEGGRGGDLSDKTLMTAARLIGGKQLELGICLDLGDAEVQRIRGENPANLTMQGFYILKAWKLQQNRNGKQPSLRELLKEMDTCGIDTESIRNEHNIPWD